MTFDQLLFDSLAHAAYHSDDEFRQIFGALSAERCEVGQAGDYFLLGVVADRACVEQHSVSFFRSSRHLIAYGLHDGGHDLTVCHIHLAAIGFYM